MLYNTTNGRHQRTSSQQVVDVVQHVLPATDMLYDIYNLLWACPLVVLYNMTVAGVRVVEFGTKGFTDGYSLVHERYKV